MPRHVDIELRRREIAEATLAVLSSQGYRGLTFRSIAEHMGGSTTLVTHYFKTQQELLEEVASFTLATWDAEIKALDAHAKDPTQRLVDLLHWLIPVSETDLAGEVARIHLLAGQLLGDEHRALFEAWDRQMRGYLRTHLEDLVAEQDLERTVELLRVVTGGVVLSVVEHPDLWSAERKFAVIDDVLGLLGLKPSARVAR